MDVQVTNSYAEKHIDTKHLAQIGSVLLTASQVDEGGHCSSTVTAVVAVMETPLRRSGAAMRRLSRPGRDTLESLRHSSGPRARYPLFAVHTAVPRQYEPRVAHAAQRHPRLH